jgi:hypothetical protein
MREYYNDLTILLDTLTPVVVYTFCPGMESSNIPMVLYMGMCSTIPLTLLRLTDTSHQSARTVPPEPAGSSPGETQVCSRVRKREAAAHHQARVRHEGDSGPKTLGSPCQRASGEVL